MARANADPVTDLSSRRDSVQKLRMQLDALPDVRQQLVDALRQAIRDGTYKISPQAIATAMLANRGLKVR